MHIAVNAKVVINLAEGNMALKFMAGYSQLLCKPENKYNFFEVAHKAR